MATVKTNVIQIDTAPAAKSVKDLRSELKELRDTLLNLDKGTEEYSQTLQQAADIQHELREQTAELNASAMDFGQITSNMTKTAAGMVGAFQSVTALMGMFGVESEEAQKAILKLQQSMAIIQGLQAMDEGVKAFKRLGTAIKNSSLFAELFTSSMEAKTVATVADTAATNGATIATNAFKTALVSTGIGAIAVAIGVLIANWDKLTSTFNKGTEATDRLAAAQKRLKEEAEAAALAEAKTNAEISKLIEKAAGGNVTALERNLRDNKSALSRLGLTDKDLKNVDKQLTKIYENSQKLATGGLTDNQALVSTRAIKSAEAAIDNLAKKYGDAGKEAIKTYRASFDAFRDAQKKETETAEAEAEKRKKTTQDEVDAAKKAYDSLVDKYRDTVEKLQLEMKKELELAENNEALRLSIIEKYGQKIFEAREADIEDTRKHAYDADLKNLNDLYDKKEISSAEYYDRLRKLDAKYMLDWGSYQAAAIARYNKDLIDIRQQFLNWQISYQQYTVKIDESTRNYYDELKKSSEEHISLREEEIAALYEYRHLLNNTNGEEISYITDLLSTMESVGTEIRRLYPEILSYSAEEQQKLVTNVINSMIDSNNASINAARTTIYQIQDYYIKARESAQNWLEALNTLEARKFEDRRAQIQKEYESELDMMQKLLDQQLINKEDYYAAAETADKKYCNNYKQLVWDTYSEQVQILAEVGSATSSIGNAIQANAEYQLEAGKISEEEYKESVKRAQAYNIAGVVISTLAGIANATASIWSPNNAYLTVYGQAAMQAVITTEMLASMAAQIAQIKKQNYGVLNGTSVSAAATGSLIAPVQYTNSVQGASEMGIRDTRVYVTEHDITDTQRRVQVAQSEARF